MSGVFVSYRRTDAGLTVHDIVKALQGAVDAPIFFDLESIRAGQKFGEVIAEALQRCSVVVVALGKDWSGVRDGGARRIDEENDFFRQEIETALKTSATIIPVLIDRDEIAAPDFPAAIRGLASFHWHRIRIADKDQAITNLVGIVQEALFERHQARLSDRGGGGLVLEPYRALLRFDRERPEPDRGPRDARLREDAPVLLREELALRINTALATGRPLFVFGASGLGRSRIARSVARQLSWRYYEHRVSAKTQARDLLYSFDAVRRLNDAQTMRQPRSDHEYILPGVLWWAFDPPSARQAGAVDPNLESSASEDAVVFLDGIDRIPPGDLGELLHPIATRSFYVQETAVMVTGRGNVLVVGTADSAKAIPRDIRRRSVTYQMPLPSFDDFVHIGRQHFPHLEAGFIESVVNHLLSDSSISRQATLVEMHEFLDILAAVERLEIVPGSTNWRILLDALNIEI